MLKPWFGKTWSVTAALVIVCSIIVAGFGAAKIKQVYRRFFPDMAVLKTSYPVATGKSGRRNLYVFQNNRPLTWKSLKEISPQAIRAVLMSEDSGFYQHGGFDPEAIRDAIKYNQQKGVRVKRGGSTITQQVVKNLFLSPEKTMMRKIHELLLAVELERLISKQKILEIYLNIAEWGPSIYGIEQASQRYFHKPARFLTTREGAVLAFMLPNPQKLQNSFRGGELTAFGASRVETILERMWKTGQITDEEYSTISKEPQRSTN